MTITCGMCGATVEKIKTVDDNVVVCEGCYNMSKSYELLFKDPKAKAFVDVFKIGEDIYYNVFVFDFVNEDFQMMTTKTDYDNIYKAKYDVILMVCQYIEDYKSTVIYTDFKMLIKHLEEEYKSRSKSMKDEYYKLKKLVTEGLEVRYVEPEYNLARFCPNAFKFFHKFDDYNRKTSFQYKRGEKQVERDDSSDDSE